MRFVLRIRPIIALRCELDEAADGRVAAVVEARDLAADLDAQDGRDPGRQPAQRGDSSLEASPKR